MSLIDRFRVAWTDAPIASRDINDLWRGQLLDMRRDSRVEVEAILLD
jgi:hypothetical protein